MGRKQIYLSCTIPGCQNDHKAKGLCNMHYVREKEHQERRRLCRQMYYDQEAERWKSCRQPRLAGCAIPICADCVDRLRATLMVVERTAYRDEE